TALIAAGDGKWFCKGGALGYFAAGVFASEQGKPAVGIALKIEDGSHQVACQVAVEVFAQLGLLDDRLRRRLASWHEIVTKSPFGEPTALSHPQFELILESGLRETETS
ncbi:asparaginase, partial [Candidatus Sumerlaeota bacterium]|nr:asparaginase [Candidatus Sumerlaeota bacterium]